MATDALQANAPETAACREARGEVVPPPRRRTAYAGRAGQGSPLRSDAYGTAPLTSKP
jgi:hypothetical protein